MIVGGSATDCTYVIGVIVNARGTSVTKSRQHFVITLWTGKHGFSGGGNGSGKAEEHCLVFVRHVLKGNLYLLCHIFILSAIGPCLDIVR